MKKKKVLIHTIVFSPDGVSTAYLYNDIALGFKENGYDVVVLTTTPHYNIVQSEIEKQPMSRFWGGLYYKSNFRGIEVYHVPQKKFKRATFRMAGFVYWHLISLVLGLFQSNISLILSPSPPLSLGLVSIILAKLKNAKAVYNVQEIYPDFLINQGSLKSGFIIKLLRKLEHFVYNQSDRVTTIDNVFYQTIIDRFNDPSKLLIVPNFVDTDIYKPIDATDSSLLNKNLFPNKDVLKVMYAGNIGHAQDWDPLLQIARNLLGLPIEFWVIGEGVLKTDLKNEIVKQSLENIHLLPYQPRDSMAGIIGFADIHFIFMNPQMEGQGFPSKVYTIMACKKPLVIISSKTTPLYHFLKDKQCAFLVTEPMFEKKCNEIETVLKSLSDNKYVAKEIGEKGYQVILEHYSKRAVVKKYTDLCDSLTA